MDRALDAMWGSRDNLLYQILCSLSESHHGLVNRNDHLIAAEFEFVVGGRQPLGIAQINLSVRGQEEKLKSPWLMSGHISNIQTYQTNSLWIG